MKIFNDYKSQLKLVEVEELLDLLFYRPLAYLFVKTILSTNLTPNHLTISAMIFGTIGGLLYIIDSSTSLILAGILLIVYDVLDCADGQLARIKKNGTVIGRILDGFADYIVSIFVYLGIGFGFALNSSEPLFYWIIILLAALSNAAHSIILDYYRNRFLDYALNRESLLGDNLKSFYDELENLKSRKGNLFEKIVIWTYIKYSNVQLKMASSSVESEYKKYDRDDFLKKHKLIMHLWTYVGPTSELTFLIICSFLGRLDIYLWGLATVANIYVISLYLIQRRINKSTKLNGNK